MTDLDTLPARLIGGVADQDDHRQAAIRLLVWHGFWLRRSDFVKACVVQRGGTAHIRWEGARAFAFGNPHASSSELAVLDIAVSLGTDRYKLRGFGHAHLRAVAEAFATACGQRLEPTAAETGPAHNHPDFIPGDTSCLRCALDAEEKRVAGA